MKKIRLDNKEHIKKLPEALLTENIFEQLPEELRIKKIVTID